MQRLRPIKERLCQVKGYLRQIEDERLRQIENERRRSIGDHLRSTGHRILEYQCLFKEMECECHTEGSPDCSSISKGCKLPIEMKRKCLCWIEQLEYQRECLNQIEMRCNTDQPLKTKVYYRRWTRKREPNCDPSNRIIHIITKGTKVIIVAYDNQGGSLEPKKVAKGLAKKKTHKGAKGGRGRERNISGGRDGKAIRDINRDLDLAPHIQKTGRPQVGFHFSQANVGVEGQDESWDGLEREKGSGGRDGGTMGGGHEEEAVSDIRRDYHQTLHIERNRRPEVGFGVSQANDSVERRGGSPDECRDVEGDGSKSGANQARDGKGEGSLLGESQGQDRGEGSTLGENQGGDRNVEGSGSSDDEDERERQRRVRGDIEHGRQESNQEEVDFSRISETFMAIIGATTIAAVDFHNSGSISSRILGLLIAINVFGFLCCMTSMLHRHRKPRAACIFGTIGAAAGGLGLLLLVSVPFSSYYRWMILGLGSLAILVIFVLAFFP